MPSGRHLARAGRLLSEVREVGVGALRNLTSRCEEGIARPPPLTPLSLYQVLQVMSLRVVKRVVKALVKVMEVLRLE